MGRKFPQSKPSRVEPASKLASELASEREYYSPIELSDLWPELGPPAEADAEPEEAEAAAPTEEEEPPDDWVPPAPVCWEAAFPAPPANNVAWAPARAGSRKATHSMHSGGAPLVAWWWCSCCSCCCCCCWPAGLVVLELEELRERVNDESENLSIRVVSDGKLAATVGGCS